MIHINKFHIARNNPVKSYRRFENGMSFQILSRRVSFFKDLCIDISTTFRLTVQSDIKNSFTLGPLDLKFETSLS